MPARDSLEARWLCSSILAIGEPAVAEICRRLGPQGTEANARAEDALQCLATYVMRPGGEGDRQMFVSALAQALASPRPAREASFLLARLEVAGRAESMVTLSRFLADPSLCEPAAQAMVAIREGAEPPLRAALSGAGRDNRITILKALGELRSNGSVEALSREAASEDAGIRRTALAALANIGDPASEKILASTLNAASEGERDGATWNMLLYARRRAEAGDGASATRIARGVAGTRQSPSDGYVRVAVLDLLVDVEGPGAMADIVAALKDTDNAVRVAALRASARVQGATATSALLAELKKAPPAVRAEILDALARRGDKAAAAGLLEAVNDQDSTVRSAAIEASARLLSVEAVPALLGRLERSSDQSDIEAVKQALRQMPPKESIALITSWLPRLTPQACVGMLDLLAGYGTLVTADPILKLATSENPAVRSAAMKSLGSIGRAEDQQKLIDLLLEAPSENEQAIAMASLVSASGRITEAADRTARVIAAYEHATPSGRLLLLRALGRLGGGEALRLVAGETKSLNEATKEVAVRALADWPTIEAFDSLLAIARGAEKLTLHVIALRGCVRQVEGASLDPATATVYHRRTLAAARRVEEKRLVIGALGNIRSAEALRAVVPYMSNDTLALDAAMAAGKIAAGSAREPEERGDRDMSRVFIENAVSPRIRPEVIQSFDARSTVNRPPEGFTSLFNGRDLTGWKGLVGNPISRAAMAPADLEGAQLKADSVMRAHWSVINGVLVFDGKGESICTVKEYADFEMILDWMIQKEGDSGIYLRGTPQVQIWDPARWPEGSGGLYNNEKHPAKPLVCADRPVGQWNTFRIRMIGDRVSVWLNDVLVVDSVALENYWDRQQPIFPLGQIELQAHSTPLFFRNVYIREIPTSGEQFAGPLFNGKDLAGWEVVDGNAGSWGVAEGILYTQGGEGGWLSTVREFGDFQLDLEFRVPPGGNSGVFIRAPRGGDPAYTGMEIQVLDDYAPEYAGLKAWQYAGSIYGVQPPSERASKQANQWQQMRIFADGPRVSVTLNGRLVVDADLVSHMDKESLHPGLKQRRGYIGLQNHGSHVEYRNIQIRTFR